jgi:hypothetical protein
MSPRTKVYRKDKLMSENLRHPYPIAKAFTLRIYAFNFPRWCIFLYVLYSVHITQEGKY